MQVIFEKKNFTDKVIQKVLQNFISLVYFSTSTISTLIKAT